MEHYGLSQIGSVVTRPAENTPEDLRALLQIEQAAFDPTQFDESAGATEETLKARLGLLVGKKWVFLCFDRKTGEPVGSIMLQPTNKHPDSSRSWDEATDNGRLQQTFDPEGEHVYIVSLGTALHHRDQESAALNLVHAMLLRWREHAVMRPGSLLFFCSRVVGLRRYLDKQRTRDPAPSERQLLALAERYAHSVDQTGTPRDPMLGNHVSLVHTPQVSPDDRLTIRFMPDGYPPDHDSEGHGVMVAVSDPEEALQSFWRYVNRLLCLLDQREATLADGTTGHQVHLGVAEGCGDWRGWAWNDVEGITYRPKTCTFCTMPEAVGGVLRGIYGLKQSTPELVREMAADTVDYLLRAGKPIASLAVFNAGSFPAMKREKQEILLDQVLRLKPLGVRELIIETRADHRIMRRDWREAFMRSWVKRLREEGIAVVVRIGVESIESRRLRDLRKGHTNEALKEATEFLHGLGVKVHAYVLVKPSPGHPDEVEIEHAVTCTQQVVTDLGMDGVILNLTFPTTDPHSGLLKAWHTGEYGPPTWPVIGEVLRQIRPHFEGNQGLTFHPGKQEDEPPPWRVSSFDERGTVPSLKDMNPADREQHKLYNRFVATRDWSLVEQIGVRSTPDFNAGIAHTEGGSESATFIQGQG